MPALRPIGTPFIELPSVDSTNNYAMGLVREGMAQHGTAVFTLRQTAGKGQRNRQWESEEGSNIAISLIAAPQQFGLSLPFLLSMATAVATHRLLSRFFLEDLTIKWPNDLYWRDRKAAGILIENLWQQHDWKAAVIGIGINVNQTAFGTLGAKAVSIRQATGKVADPRSLAVELCGEMEAVLQELEATPDRIVEIYNELLYRRGEVVRFRKGGRLFDARIKEVTTAGQLVVEHGVEELFDVGEVEWLI